jgi:hypothetical protein
MTFELVITIFNIAVNGIDMFLVVPFSVILAAARNSSLFCLIIF